MYPSKIVLDTIDNAYGHFHTVKAFDAYLTEKFPYLPDYALGLAHCIRRLKMCNPKDVEREICAIRGIMWLKSDSFDGKLDDVFFEIKGQYTGNLAGKCSWSHLSLKILGGIRDLGEKARLIVCGFIDAELIFAFEVPYGFILEDLEKLLKDRDCGSVCICWMRFAECTDFTILFLNEDIDTYKDRISKDLLTQLKERTKR